MTAEPMTPERLAEIRRSAARVFHPFGWDPDGAIRHRAELLALVDAFAVELEGQADALERQLADLETARHERDHHAAEADRLADLLADADDQLDEALRCPCNGYPKRGTDQ